VTRGRPARIPALPPVALLALAACWSQPDPVHLVVHVAYPGATAAEVEQGVTLPVEEALRGVAGVSHQLAVSEEGRALLFVEVQPPRRQLAEIEAQQAVYEAIRTVKTLPESSQAAQVWIEAERRTWLRAPSDEEAVRQAIGGLASQGERALTLGSAAAVEAWHLQPSRLRTHELAPQAVVTAVDAELGAGRWRGGKTPVGQGLTLEQVAVPSKDLHSHAWIDGQQASAIAVEGTSTVPGWTALASASASPTCVRLARAGGDQPAPQTGLWVREGDVLFGRVPSGAAPVPGAVTWPCEHQVVRVAVLGSTPDTDLELARSSLAAWPGVEAVIDVPTPASLEPELSVSLDAQKAAALGLDAQQVQQSLSFWGQVRKEKRPEPTPGSAGYSAAAADAVLVLAGDQAPARVVLHGPRDPDELGAWPVVSPDGVWIPLMQLATLSYSAPPRARTRVDGQPAVVVDLVLAQGARLQDQPVPSDVRVVELEGLGPDRVWR